MTPDDASLPVSLLQKILGRYVSRPVAQSMIRQQCARMAVSMNAITEKDLPRLCKDLQRSVLLFVAAPEDQRKCIAEMQVLAGRCELRDPQLGKRVTVAVTNEADAVTARSLAREYAGQLGFDVGMQIRIATAVSELVRNIVQYADRGTVTLEHVQGARPAIRIEARDHGPGIANVDEIMGGRYVSRTGMGVGLMGTKRIMDEFDLKTGPGGTRVRVTKYRN